MSRPLGAAGLGLLLLCVLSVAQGSPVAAHALLAAAEPAPNDLLGTPPAFVSLTFSEPVSDRASGAQLLDAIGVAIEHPPATFSDDGRSLRVTIPPLEPGVYNVAWWTVSRVDGHGYEGVYPFTILNRDGSIPEQENGIDPFSGARDGASESIAVRFLLFVGLVTAAGAALILLLTGAELAADALRGLVMMTAVGGGLLVIGGGLELAVIRAGHEGVPVGDLLLETRVGGAWLARMGCAALLLCLVPFVRDSPRLAGAISLGVAAGFVWALSLTSHAAAAEGHAWAIGIDTVHAVAAVGWLGAVLGLVVATRLAGGAGPLPTRSLARFSLAATALVATVLASGLLGAVIEVDAPGRVLTSTYGRVLLVKLVLVALLLVVAAVNARRARAWLHSGRADHVGRFVRVAAIEVVLGLAALAAAAVLTHTAVSSVALDDLAREPYDRTLRGEDFELTLEIVPNRAGNNAFRATVRDLDGAPLVVGRIRLEFQPLDDSPLGPATLSLAVDRSTTGVYIGESDFLALPGRWEVVARVEGTPSAEARLSYEVETAAPPAPPGPPPSPWTNPFGHLSPGSMATVLVVLAAGGIVVVLAGRGRRVSYS